MLPLLDDRGWKNEVTSNDAANRRDQVDVLDIFHDISSCTNAQGLSDMTVIRMHAYHKDASVRGRCNYALGGEQTVDSRE